MKKALAPLDAVLELKRQMLEEIRAKHDVTHILLFVLLGIVLTAIVVFVVIKLVQRLENDDYGLYEDFDDMDDLGDLEFEEHDVLADDGDFVK
jgi:ABC-type transporter Mla subunit MlaD